MSIMIIILDDIIMSVINDIMMSVIHDIISRCAFFIHILYHYIRYDNDIIMSVIYEVCMIQA